MFNKTLLILTTFATLFSGCASSTYMRHDLNEDKSISVASFVYKDDRILITSTKGFAPLKDYMRLAAEKTRESGKNYFALIGSGVNNFAGFPINTYSELQRYVDLRKMNPKFRTNGSNLQVGDDPIRQRSGKFHVLIRTLPDSFANGPTTVWDVNQTLIDTQ